MLVRYSVLLGVLVEMEMEMEMMEMVVQVFGSRDGDGDGGLDVQDLEVLPTAINTPNVKFDRVVE